MRQDLAAEFPGSDWISATAAMAQYNLRNFDEAQELFEDLLESDPHRIDVSPFPASAIRQCKGEIVAAACQPDCRERGLLGTDPTALP